ncbi:class I SAM-dependent methyltransferase [Agromyces humatus]|uniref:Class I SAM-dependent methyltransferase n=1 Tax=Agromyces humatus TaxID=279573 RepID=A0ABN2K8B6_9MICO|nr:class I SAM-dependent methyltransferase [Agromyces humatus]
MITKVLDPAAYWQPPVLVLSAWLEHAPFAYSLVAMHRPNSIVELGTHSGYSFFVFCEAVKRLGLESQVTATDTWQGDEHAGFYDDDVYESVRRVADADYSGIARLNRGYFDDFVESTPDGSIDLLHIDGRHRYEDVRHDFETWLPKLSDRAVVLFHDTFERKKDFGVYRYWAEIADRWPSFEFEHGHGLGVLAVGENVSAEVLRFLADANADPDGTRRQFHGLGRRIRAAWDATLALEDATRHAADAQSRADALDGRLREADLLVAELRGGLEAASADARTAASEADVAHRLIAEVGERSAETERRLRETERRLTAADLRIDELTTSRSWRMTAPFRGAGTLARRARRRSGG